MSNKRRRHTPEQIIHKLAEDHKMLAAGNDLEEVCRQLQVSESTWHRWRDYRMVGHAGRIYSEHLTNK